MAPTKVGLVQINNSFANACYFPYSVGSLQAYFQAHSQKAGHFEFLRPIYCRLPLQEAAARLQEAHVVAFSVYVWNYRLSIAIARVLKRHNPSLLTVFGGPSIPDDAEGFLRNHPWVDVACHGEGEKVFQQILENFDTRRWEKIPSVSYLCEGEFVRTRKEGRIHHLGSVPSPYLAGVFDALLEGPHNHQWLGLWETNRGCPFACSYCTWGSSLLTRMALFDMGRVEREIEWFARNSIEFIFCCDANFGLFPRDLEIVKSVARIKQRYGFPEALSVQNTKNATERSYLVQKTLSEAGLNKGVNLALQTVDRTTLENIGRSNISLDSFHELQRRFGNNGIETFTDLILALPGETYDSFVDGVNEIIAKGQHHRIQFINLAILPNSRMCDRDYRQEHGLVGVENHVVNIRGTVEDFDDGIDERQELVVATKTMPREAWSRTRVFSWWTSLLHFDKLLQIPFILLHEICALTYRELLEAFLIDERGTYPVLSEINYFFQTEAQSIQDGGAEYYHAPDCLNIYWPHDEYALIRLHMEDKLGSFYEEAERLVCQILDRRGISVPGFLGESMTLNRNLLKRPFQKEDLLLPMDYGIYEFYRSVLLGEQTRLDEGSIVYRIDRTEQVWSSWHDWMRDVVWYGNKKAAYFYAVRREDTL